METDIAGPVLGVVQLAAALSGVPFATGAVMVLQMINTACVQVSLHKKKSAQLVQRCTTLLNFVGEQATLLADTDTAAVFDDVELVLSSVHHRIQKWTDCGKVKRLLKGAQIARDLDWCHAEVDSAMDRLHVAAPVAVLRMQHKSMDLIQRHEASLIEMRQLLISPAEISQAVQQHKAGGNAAHELMRMGQERLIGLRDMPSRVSSILSDGRQIDESPTASRSPSPTTVQDHLEKVLLELHQLTNIPPATPILNNQVKKKNSAPVRTGLHSEVFEGRWLGGKKVALKTLRILDKHDTKSARLQIRFEHEIVVWSKLKHENVLPMYGIVTDMGPIHIVSPWQLDNVRNYRAKNPNVNPLKLLSQAAKGLEYLHDQRIVHGNLKCTNMLISEEGIVTLSDFGLTQVLTDLVGKSVMTAFTSASAIRWHAPELILREDSAPTMSSDVFAFGMSVLELLTLKPPYSHRKRDVFVIQDLTHGALPQRPEEPEAVPWITDELWEALERCWKWNPEERILLGELLQCLDEASESATKQQNAS